LAIWLAILSTILLRNEKLKRGKKSERQILKYY
jgi:hypothetical protein